MSTPLAVNLAASFGPTALGSVGLISEILLDPALSGPSVEQLVGKCAADIHKACCPLEEEPFLSPDYEIEICSITKENTPAELIIGIERYLKTPSKTSMQTCIDTVNACVNRIRNFLKGFQPSTDSTWTNLDDDYI